MNWQEHYNFSCEQLEKFKEKKLQAEWVRGLASALHGLEPAEFQIHLDALWSHLCDHPRNFTRFNRELQDHDGGQGEICVKTRDEYILWPRKVWELLPETTQALFVARGAATAQEIIERRRAIARFEIEAEMAVVRERASSLRAQLVALEENLTRLGGSVPPDHLDVFAGLNE